MRSEPDRAIGNLDRLTAATQMLLGDVRRLVDDLRPPSLDQLGLVGAIREHTRAFNSYDSDAQSGFSVEVWAGADLGELSAGIEVAAFRIAVEAVTNAARHSGGQLCTVEVSVVDGFFVLDVTDDGKGITAPDEYHRGVGLGSMRQRAAELGGLCVISLRPGRRGTVVHVRLPLRPFGSAK